MQGIQSDGEKLRELSTRLLSPMTSQARRLSPSVLPAAAVWAAVPQIFIQPQVAQHGWMLKKILNIAVPNGIENGLFQLVKVALSSIVALFGTYQIAANGVAQSIWSLAALMGVAMSTAFIPVIGQCMGADDTDEAEYYFKKLMKITVVASVAWNVIIFAATPLMLMAHDLSAETKRLVIWLVVIHNVFNALAYPFSGALSVISTIGIRLLLSMLFGILLDMGVIGIAFAMCADWLCMIINFT